MSHARLKLCSLALAAASSCGCATSWMADIGAIPRPNPSPAASHAAAEPDLSPSRLSRRPVESDHPPVGTSEPSLGEVLVDIETMRQRSPADYAALQQALAESQGTLPPFYDQMFRQQLTAMALQGQQSPAPETSRIAPALDSPAAALTTQHADSPLIAPSTSLSATQPQTSISQTAFTNSEGIATEQLVRDDVESPVTATQAADVPPLAATEGEASNAVSSSADWRDSLRDTLDALNARLAEAGLEREDKSRLEAYRRLLHVVANDREEAVAAIEQLDEDQREFWKHQLYGLLVALDAEGKHAASRRAALALRELRQSEHYLANISTLDLKNMALCSEVVSYGEFKEFESYSFRAGEEVVLYVEIENFAAHSKGDRYETELHGSYEVFDDAGRRVTSVVLPEDRQVSNNRRRDYFIPYLISLPQTAAGSYRLQLTIEDAIGKKSNQAALDFRIR